MHDQALGEGLGGRVQVVYHDVNLPPTYQVGGVGVGLHKNQSHGASCAEVVGAVIV